MLTTEGRQKVENLVHYFLSGLSTKEKSNYWTLILQQFDAISFGEKQKLEFE